MDRPVRERGDREWGDRMEETGSEGEEVEGDKAWGSVKEEDRKRGWRGHEDKERVVG